MPPDKPLGTLRVIDFGRVSALRSQTLWHAIAAGVSAGAPATLSFLRPSQPYVCIGYHRRLAEVDLDECGRRGLPVLRRMVGGGPVYLDDGQLFFQITVPPAAVSPVRTVALRQLLLPVVEAFRRVGVDASLDEAGEIVVGDRKVCGHGAGQIDDAVVVVGNLIERFDHAAASAVLRVPSAHARAELQRLMERYVAPTPVDAAAFQAAAVESYATALGLAAVAGSLRDDERERLDALDRRFTDPAWVEGRSRAEPAVWQTKIRAGVGLLVAADGPTSVLASVVDGRIERASIVDPELNGTAATVAEALRGCSLRDTATALAPFGRPGQRVTTALAGAREVA